ncbi:WXG100 family type VII secretion target [Corynebacterium bovis]|uniref:ESAT-6-like protein n=2 Tax=Corynebacterium bovis TaxID=36808 RepID=A0A3R8PQC9_9CORY|nr:WXG100 family type VII secretion target [Corynebacterium bovis]MBB3116732.1 WXG100 family type VII secretion target [Corynebacterium bovis DSM 20582 = CIP 54.80]MDH2455633.1 WXG100 family type VII secretion target [Corynebacterium bovis]RRO78719.1 WXG100 family type VII secretion target [Corynebacterium bovis]RRO78825.1 WXG100 family type VII secretion target [Corynebacterium bovis]RRO83482.1 WXG100 family type VII secretion target [Corynebacterium bovis]
MNFRTTTDVMHDAAGKVDTVNSEVQAELRRLQGTVDSVSGAWQGEAQAAFGQLMVRWNDSARELHQALTSIAENIRANARGFAQVEADNAAAFRV